ncbi:fructose-specific PTS transporter subunit EIIC [Intestinibacillus massiliensis]|nr:fructose-specific PTS transporter subunit EIIC [Intestinibacillus massiliensis]
MKITDLLQKQSILLQVRAKSRDGVIDQLTGRMAKSGAVINPELYRKAVYAREAQGTTGVGDGVAIPHAKSSAVREAALCAMTIPDGVDFASMDGAPVRLVFLIAAPDTADNVHLDVLGRLSVLLMDEALRADLLRAKKPEEFLRRIDRAEREKFSENEPPQTTAPTPGDGFRVLAVTACPTGIAHTYMAAEALENAARSMGIPIKVETDGSGGAKNVLTREEIERADCIIVAADRKVDTARFDGKPLIRVRVADGIHKPQSLLRQATSPGVPIHHERGGSTDEPAEGAGRSLYKHLMNGVSHMLPFVIGGGILIALAFLFDDYNIDPANFGKNTPLAALLKTIGETAFGFMLPVLAGFIALSIGDRPALAVGFVGGMLANTGGSGFLGALLAGFLAGWIVNALRHIFDRLPKSLEGTKPVLLYPFFGILLIGVLMQLVVGPPVAALNAWLTASLDAMGNTSRVLLGGVLGAMMSIDFGGPINKAAYVFGTASIASGQPHIMAAVMLGGMVPPLAIALCSLFFKNRFTRRERGSALTNIIMGFAFITEGAIPFAAADPLRVIPACAVGSGVAGALSMFWGCTLPAPHGGIFVFPVVGKPMLYLAALAVGAAVGTVLLAILKRPVKNA